MTASDLTTVLVLAGNIILIGAVSGRFRLAMGRAGVDAATANRATLALGAFLIVWFFTVLELSKAGVFAGPVAGVPLLPVVIAAMVAAGFMLWRQSSLVRRAVDATPANWPIGVQTLRLVGIAFLVTYGAGQLPASFALPAGWGDAAVGLLAPVMAIAYWRLIAGSRAMAWSWNLLGLADLAVALGTGVLTSPGPLHLLSIDAPNLAIGSYPLAVVPGFGVPIFILLHLVAFRSLSVAAPARGDSPASLAR